MNGRAFLRGMCIGVIAGAALEMMIPARKERAMKTAVGRAIHDFGSAVDVAVDHAVETAKHMW